MGGGILNFVRRRKKRSVPENQVMGPDGAGGEEILGRWTKGPRGGDTESFVRTSDRRAAIWE